MMDPYKRRSFCRLGFLLFCGLPTSAVAFWIVWPDSTTAWETKLSQQLGLVVSIEAISHPRPGVTVLQGISLSDTETGIVAQVKQLTMSRNDHGLVVLADNPQVELRQLSRAHEMIHDRILRQWKTTNHQVTIRADEITLVGGKTERPNSNATFGDFVCNIEAIDSGSRLSVNFHVPDQTADKTEIIVERNHRSESAPTTRWFLKTNGSPFPCALLAHHIGGLNNLGDGCQFAGMIWAEQTPSGWNGDVNGRFTNVDLQRLVGGSSQHTLRGQATVTLPRARIQNGRLVNAAGSIASADGLIGTALIEATATHLKLQRKNNASENPTRFRKLDLSFQADGEKLTIRGHCDSSGSIIFDESGRPLLIESTQPTVSVLALVRTLVPASDVNVPLTEETASLLSIFPVPSVAKPDSSQRR